MHRQRVAATGIGRGSGRSSLGLAKGPYMQADSTRGAAGNNCAAVTDLQEAQQVQQHASAGHDRQTGCKNTLSTHGAEEQ
jgi:hypothetical protein